MQTDHLRTRREGAVPLSNRIDVTLSALGGAARPTHSMLNEARHEGHGFASREADQLVWVRASDRSDRMRAVRPSHRARHAVTAVRTEPRGAKRTERIFKRLFDVLGATCLLACTAPLLVAIAWLVRRDGGAAIYAHTRVGAGGREFKCLKFRSMVPGADKILPELLQRDPVAREQWEKHFKLKQDPRITRFGAFLRNSSLDELPQLLNVLKGDMSLVGPRPVVPEELVRYGDQATYYLQVRPGLTGVWQVRGRNELDYKTRVRFDAWYVRNWSTWTDAVILLQTARALITRIGAY